MKKIILLLSCVFMLNACASGARMNAMTVSTSPETIITEDNILFQSVELADVSGGKKTNPLWTSQIGNAEFQEALLNSLKAHAMISVGEVKYILTAKLEKIKQPFIGISMTVKSSIHYELKEVSTQKIIFSETIDEKYTAAFGDALLGAKRLQLANEGAIKVNISTLITKLVRKSKSGVLASNAE